MTREEREAAEARLLEAVSRFSDPQLVYITGMAEAIAATNENREEETEDAD